MQLPCWALILAVPLSISGLHCSDAPLPRSNQDAAALDRSSSDIRAPDHRRGDVTDADLGSPADSTAGDQTRPPTGWAKAQPMLHPRSNHTATPLDDGTVLVAGGRYFSSSPYYWGGTDQAERYNHQTGAWQDVGPMPRKHWEHQAVRLQDGKVMIIGGYAEDDGVTGMLDVGVEILLFPEHHHALAPSWLPGNGPGLPPGRAAQGWACPGGGRME